MQGLIFVQSLDKHTEWCREKVFPTLIKRSFYFLPLFLPLKPTREDCNFCWKLAKMEFPSINIREIYILFKAVEIKELRRFSRTFAAGSFVRLWGSRVQQKFSLNNNNNNKLHSKTGNLIFGKIFFFFLVSRV